MGSAVCLDQGFHTEVELFGFNVSKAPVLFFRTDIVETSELQVKYPPNSSPDMISKRAGHICVL